MAAAQIIKVLFGSTGVLQVLISSGLLVGLEQLSRDCEKVGAVLAQAQRTQNKDLEINKQNTALLESQWGNESHNMQQLEFN